MKMHALATNKILTSYLFGNNILCHAKLRIQVKFVIVSWVAKSFGA